MAVPELSLALQKRMKQSLATQGGDLGQELILVVERALEISTISLENATFSQETLQLNEGNTTASLGGAGYELLGDGGAVVGYVRVDPADISLLQIKSPSGFQLELDIDADSTLLMSQDLAVSGASPVTINQSVSTTSAVVFASITLGATTLVSSILDEDDLVSDSATALVTQQSVKAYIDAQISASDSWEESLAVANISGANDVIITVGQKITTDTIDETTAAAGVTIDGLLLKDGNGVFVDEKGIENEAGNLFIKFTDLFDVKILKIGDGIDTGFFFNETANVAGLQFGGLDHFSVQSAGAIMGADDSANTKIAFYGDTPIVQPATITQTFATTSSTHAARTAATLTDNGGGAAANGTIDAIADIALSTGDTYTDSAVNTAVNALVTDTKDAVKELSDQINKLIADQVNSAQVLNLVIDDLQALGLRA